MAGNQNSGRRPQSAVIARLKGNPGKRKERILETEFPQGAPAMPSTLGPIGRKVWKFVIEQCTAVPGMLKKIDTYSLGIFCHAIQDITETRAHLKKQKLRVGQLPLCERRALREAESTAIKIGCQYGWSPSDRVGKVFGGEGGPMDPLQALLGARNN